MQTKFDGISEFISRRGRIKFLKMLVRNLGSRSEVADALGTSLSTVSGWLNERSRHPSNSSLKRILNLAAEINPRGAERILEDEIDSFEGAVDTFLRRGANSSNFKSSQNREFTGERTQ